MYIVLYYMIYYTHTHTHTHTHTCSLFLSHTLTHSLSLSHTHAHTNTHTYLSMSQLPIIAQTPCKQLSSLSDRGAVAVSARDLDDLTQVRDVNSQKSVPYHIYYTKGQNIEDFLKF